MEQNTITLVVAGVGLASTFGGVLAGHVLGRRTQSGKNVEQWILDQRKQEFGDVVVALERSLNVEIERHRSYAANQRKIFLVSTDDFYRIVRTRIFTAADMQALDIEDRWREAIDEYSQDKDIDMIIGCYESLIRDLAEAAKTQASTVPMFYPD